MSPLDPAPAPADTAPVDLAIVGAGPAGMAAAATAADLGLSVAVFDEQAAPGGQIYRAVEANRHAGGRRAALLGADYAAGAALADALRAGTARLHPHAAVFEVAADGSDGAGLGVLERGAARWLHARRVLIAGGAQERPTPLPGWTLPGVMTAGAAQTALKASGLVPAGRVAIAGSGPLLYLVARQLLQAGSDVVAVLDTTPGANYRAAARHLPGALQAGPELRKGLAWRAELQRGARGLLQTGVSDLAVEGGDRATALRYRRKGQAQRIDCDLVLLHEGVVPNVHLSMAAGADHAFDPEQMCWRPVLDDHGRTSLPALLVAGDGGGIRGGEAAAEAGRLAALAVAHDLGLITARRLETRSMEPLRILARKRPLRRFLDRLYRPAESLLLPPDDDTIVCRCEEVTAGTLRRLGAAGCPGPNQAKAFSRCGMGPCQGRMCGLTASALLAQASGSGLQAMVPMRLRPPVKPLTVAELAGMEGLGAAAAAMPDMPTGPLERDEAAR